MLHFAILEIAQKRQGAGLSSLSAPLRDGRLPEDTAEIGRGVGMPDPRGQVTGPGAGLPSHVKTNPVAAMFRQRIMLPVPARLTTPRAPPLRRRGVSDGVGFVCHHEESL